MVDIPVAVVDTPAEAVAVADTARLEREALEVLPMKERQQAEKLAPAQEPRVRHGSRSSAAGLPGASADEVLAGAGRVLAALLRGSFCLSGTGAGSSGPAVSGGLSGPHGYAILALGPGHPGERTGDEGVIMEHTGGRGRGRTREVAHDC